MAKKFDSMLEEVEHILKEKELIHETDWIRMQEFRRCQQFLGWGMQPICGFKICSLGKDEHKDEIDICVQNSIVSLYLDYISSEWKSVVVLPTGKPNTRPNTVIANRVSANYAAALPCLSVGAKNCKPIGMLLC